MAHKSFTDEVLDRRTSFEKRQAKAAVSLQQNLEVSLKASRKKLRELRNFTDPKTGKFISNDLSRRAVRAQIRDINRVLEREMQNATQKLIDQRERAYIQSVLDSRFAIEKATADQARVTTTFSQMFEEAARVSQESPVLGIKPANAMRGVLADQQRRTQNILTQAVINGESISKTANKLAAANEIGKRAATRITRTNLNASANEANRILYDSDPEVFSGYRWDSTFDSRTSAICASLHGRFYPLNSIPPGPPAHPNCRSTLIPEFRDPRIQEFAEDGGRRVRTFNKSGEQTGSEIIESDRNFDTWLRKQPDAVTKKVTGSNVANRLFRSGKISTRDIVGDDLVPRSSKDIVQRALARRPDDPQLRKLADELGVRKVKASTIENRDKRVQGKVRHTIGTTRRPKIADRERIEALDQRKQKRTKDVVRAAGKRQAKVTATKTKRPPKDFELKPGATKPPEGVIFDVNDPAQLVWNESLTEVELESVRAYAGDHFNAIREIQSKGQLSPKFMDKALKDFRLPDTLEGRREVNQRLKKFIGDIEGAVNRAPLREGWSFRGMHGLSPAQINQFKQGSTITFDAFTSASRTAKIAEDFALPEAGGADRSGSVLFKVYGRGVSIERTNFASQFQDELLHLKGSRFRIASVKRTEDGTLEVIMRQLIRK